MRQGAALPVPRMVVEARRIAQRDSLPVGLPRRRAGLVRAPGGEGGAVGWLGLPQPRHGRRAVRRVPRRLPPHDGEPSARSPLQGGARRQADAGELEGVPGGLHGGLPRRGDAPDAARIDGRRQLALRRLRQLQPRHLPELHPQPAPRRQAAVRAVAGRQAVRPVPPSDERPRVRARGRQRRRRRRPRWPRVTVRRRCNLDRRTVEGGRPAPVPLGRWAAGARVRGRTGVDHAADRRLIVARLLRRGAA